MHRDKSSSHLKKIFWTPLASLMFACLTALCSCTDNSTKSISTDFISDYTYDQISSEIKDSLIILENSGLIHNSLTKVTALESEDNPTMEWILENGKAQDFQELLYNHPSPGLKAVGVKGLIRKKDSAMFQHLKFSFDQDINIQYGFFCQKLGGYFLTQLNYSVADSFNRYFSQDEFETLNEIVFTRRFGCTLH